MFTGVAREAHEWPIQKAVAFLMARLSLLTHLSEVGTVATQVGMRDMKFSVLPPSHLQKIQAESQCVPRVLIGSVFQLLGLTSSLRHKRGTSCLCG